MMGARGGDIASIDIIVPAKNTGIAPGPMLTEFKITGILVIFNNLLQSLFDSQIKTLGITFAGIFILLL